MKLSFRKLQGGKSASESPSKQLISGTDNVTAILEPHVHAFCETVIEEGGLVVEAQETEAQQEIIKAARATESQTMPEESMYRFLLFAF